MSEYNFDEPERPPQPQAMPPAFFFTSFASDLSSDGSVSSGQRLSTMELNDAVLQDPQATQEATANVMVQGASSGTLDVGYCQDVMAFAKT